MNRRKRKGFIASGVLLLSFVLWTFLIQTVDVQPVGEWNKRRFCRCQHLVPPPDRRAYGHGKEPIYRGNGQQNAKFVLEILEKGNYHISVSGHQAKGNIAFIRIHGGQE